MSGIQTLGRVVVARSCGTKRSEPHSSLRLISAKTSSFSIEVPISGSRPRREPATATTSNDPSGRRRLTAATWKPMNSTTAPAMASSVSASRSPAWMRAPSPERTATRLRSGGDGPLMRGASAERAARCSADRRDSPADWARARVASRTACASLLGRTTAAVRCPGDELLMTTWRAPPASTSLFTGYADDHVAGTVSLIREDDRVIVVDPGMVPSRAAILDPLERARGGAGGRHRRRAQPPSP